MLGTEIMGNSLLIWCVATAISLATFIALYLLRFILLKKAGSFFQKFHLIEPFVRALQNTKLFLILVIALFAGSRALALSDNADDILRAGAFIALFIQAGLWINCYAFTWLERYKNRQVINNPAVVTSFGAIRFIIRAFTWILVFILILDNLGFSITTLVAGLGIGGIAVALALQTILSDLFASLSIVIDKTFAVGDFIAVDNYMGTVEYVGLKTTRISSLSGEQIVFSNTDLLQGRIKNYGKMRERRVQVSFEITYQTPREALEAVPGIVKDAITGQEKTRFDRAHFTGFGASGLTIEYVYFVLSPEYNLYLDIQQAINLFLHQEFSRREIVFAYPTQSLFVEALPELGQPAES